MLAASASNFELAGAAAFGAVIGWYLYYVNRYRQDEPLTTTVAHMFRFDENLFDFYKLVEEDGELLWCAIGAGRMLRAPTVFEDVVKTN
jgi:3-methyladenine DNA glycosylase/8-oxoguanine DNA glycosylase